MLMVDVTEAGRFLRSVRAGADGSFGILVPVEPRGALRLAAGGALEGGGSLVKDVALAPDAKEVEIRLK